MAEGLWFLARKLLWLAFVIVVYAIANILVTASIFAALFAMTQVWGEHQLTAGLITLAAPYLILGLLYVAYRPAYEAAVRPLRWWQVQIMSRYRLGLAFRALSLDAQSQGEVYSVPHFYRVRTTGRNFETVLHTRRYQTLADFEKVSERIRSALGAKRLTLREIESKQILLRAIYDEPLEQGWAGQDFLAAIKSGTKLNELPIGVDENGAKVCLDFVRSPHALFAGTSGSGKSVGLNALLASICQLDPKPQLILIDPKRVELSPWMPFARRHAVETEEMTSALVEARDLMEERYRVMAEKGIRDLNKAPGYLSHLGGPLFVVVDELAELLAFAGKDAGVLLSSIAQKGRAASVFLITATQNPKAELFSKSSGTETLRSNLSNILAFRVTRQSDSDVILGAGAASEGRDASIISPDLPGCAYSSWSDERLRVPYLDDDQIQLFVAANAPAELEGSPEKGEIDKTEEISNETGILAH